MGNHLPHEVRTCETTGLSVCLNAQRFIKLHAVMAVVFLLVGLRSAVSVDELRKLRAEFRSPSA